MKIFIKKLGCPKNDVDGDMIASGLIRAGHEIVFDERGADAVVVNTCGFIQPAKEESIEEILRYERAKNENGLKKLFVTGCLSQRYGKELFHEIEGIDGIFGLGEMEKLVKAVSGDGKRILNVSDGIIKEISHSEKLPRFVAEYGPYEYLKIADGCNRFCSYCAIPLIRGRYRSRSIESIVDEAKYLVDRGKKELILVSQEGTGYGRDMDGDINPVKLLRELEKISGLEWIRLMYLHPEALNDELIELMTHSEKVLEYFDIPLQHVNDRILKSMNRPVNRKWIEEVLGKIKSASDENIIRTTFIVGFPGETKHEFTELLEFVSDYHLDRVGAFQYSPEEGTPAERLTGRLSDKDGKKRLDLLMSLQQEIAFEKNIALIGSIKQVIIDEVKDSELAEGRTRGDCPEIDQTVFVKGDSLRRGDLIDADIIMARGYDLIAERRR